MPKKQKQYLLLLIILLLAFSRFLFPESDPAWWKSSDDIHDEAWWAENVRLMVAGANWPGAPYARAWAVGPLTAAIHQINFSCFGVSFFSLRLIALIPSVLSILLLLWKNIPGIPQSKRYQAALLLAVLPAFWSMSRIGHLEALLSFILLVVVFLSYATSRRIWMTIGVLLAMGMLVKLSFIYCVIPVYFWFLSRHILLRNLVLAAGVFATLLLSSYWVYFLPHTAEFDPFVKYFSASYYTSAQLLDPRGWILRLAWLPEKLLITTPVSILLIASVLIRFGQGTSPERKTGIAPLLAMLLLGLLLSDFSDRRLILLLILLPLVLVENHTSISSERMRYILAWVCGLTFFTSFSAICFPGQNSNLNELMEIVPWFIAIYTALFFLAIFVAHKMSKDASLLIMRIGIICWISKAMWASASQLYTMTGWNIYLSLFSLTFLLAAAIWFSWILQVAQTKIHVYSISVITVAGILIISTVAFHPEYSLRHAALEIQTGCINRGAGIGPESLVELTLLSPCNTDIYLDAKINDHTQQKKYGWFAGMTTPAADADSLQRLLNQARWMLDDSTTKIIRTIPVLSSPKGFREQVLISFP